MENLINGLKNNRAFAFSSLLVLLLLGIALAAPWIAPYDPLEAVMKNAYLPPSGEHLFGTDKLGRDNFSRVLYGASYSLSSVLILVAIIFVVGTSLGVLAGYFGGKKRKPYFILRISVTGLLKQSHNIYLYPQLFPAFTY